MIWAARLEGGEGCQASRRPHRDLLGLTAPRSLQVGPPGPRPTGRCARGLWHKAVLGPRCCCCRPPSVRPEEPPSHRCCCSFDSCCEEWDSWPGKQKWFSFFFFLYKWKENPGEAAPPPPKCDALPLLQFLSHCFRLWSRDHPADSPGSNPGGVCVTPFYLYKKKKKMMG